MEKTKQREIKLDIIRIFALLCVIGVHFFLNSGFYNVTIEGKKMLIMCIIRSFFIICVPMFITLTGYLMNKKKLSKQYYKGIVKTLIIYLICSIIYSLFLKFYLNYDMNIKLFIENVLSYNGTKYAWYIEMYIGLFLLIPFLNLIFNNLNSKKEAKILLFTLLVLVGLPSILNVFRFDLLEWWKNPASSFEYMKLVPSWWTSIYPIFYYFLGAYLSKYEVNISKKLNVLLLIVVVILDGLFNFYRSSGIKYLWAPWNDYNSLTIMVITFLVFNLLLKIKIKKDNKIINNILITMSNACLGAFLISCIFDNIYYTRLKESVPMFANRFVYAPLMIILVFVSSIIVSILINLIYETIIKLLEKPKIK